MVSSAKRLFLALWPDQATRNRFVAIQKSLAHNPRLRYAKPVSAENIHLTLHFLGDVAEARIAQLEACLANVTAEAFSLNIDHRGYFPKAGVCWIGATNTPDELVLLLEQSAGCVANAVENYRQSRFTPHITLFRKARHPLEIAAFEQCEWNIDRFVLVSSLTRQEGVEYTVMREWPL
jgi:RNA 2',3'-cyclic 3'-phosphodiesterase